MLPQRRFKACRLFLGFLLAPAVVSISLFTSVDVVLARLGANPDGPALIGLAASSLVVGVGMPYLAAVWFGLPYVIIILGRRRLTFRTIMIPTFILALIYPAIVYSSFCYVDPPHPFAEAVALPQIPAVILSGLCFYLIAVWKLGRDRS